MAWRISATDAWRTAQSPYIKDNVFATLHVLPSQLLSLQYLVQNKIKTLRYVESFTSSADVVFWFCFFTTNVSGRALWPEFAVARVCIWFQPLTPNSRSVFCAGVSLNIHSFIHSVWASWMWRVFTSRQIHVTIRFSQWRNWVFIICFYFILFFIFYFFLGGAREARPLSEGDQEDGIAMIFPPSLLLCTIKRQMGGGGNGGSHGRHGQPQPPPPLVMPLGAVQMNRWIDRNLKDMTKNKSLLVCFHKSVRDIHQ